MPHVHHVAFWLGWAPWLVSLSGAAVPACASAGTQLADGHHVDPEDYALKRKKLLERAAFDFACPADGLSFVVLDDNAYGGVKQMGVTGCGQRATYVWDWDRGWIRDGAARYPPAPSGDATSP